jgi:hypothetical protein
MGEVMDISTSPTMRPTMMALGDQHFFAPVFRDLAHSGRFVGA